MSPRWILLAILLPMAVGIAQAQVAVTVTSYTITPEVFMPGDTGTVRVTVKNTGSTATSIESATYTAVQFETLTGTYTNAGSLGAGESSTIAFTVRAPGSEGTSKGEVQLVASGQGTSTRFPIPLQVDGSRVDVLTANVPSLVSISGSEITLVVANLRPNAVRSVRVTPQAEGIVFTPQERYFDSLPSGNSSQTTFTASATEAGKKEIAFQVTFNNGDNVHRSIAKTASVVAEVSPTLEVSLAESTRIAPGGSGELAFQLKNRGEQDLRNIELSWTEPGSKIVPVGATNSRYISSLKAGAETTVSFQAASAPDAVVGVYSLNVTLRYTDDTNLQRVLTHRIGVFVGAGTDIEVTLQEVTGTSISFLVANVGTSSANSIVVRVPRATGANSAALGNLNPGDFTFATFRLGGGTGRGASSGRTGTGGDAGHAGETGGGAFSGRGGMESLRVEVDYTDSTGFRRSITKEVSLDRSQSFSQEAASRFQQSQGHGFPLLEVLALVAVAGALYWKRDAVRRRLKRPSKPLP